MGSGGSMGFRISYRKIAYSRRSCPKIERTWRGVRDETYGVLGHDRRGPAGQILLGRDVFQLKSYSNDKSEHVQAVLVPTLI